MALSISPITNNFTRVQKGHPWVRIPKMLDYDEQ